MFKGKILPVICVAMIFSVMSGYAQADVSTLNATVRVNVTVISTPCDIQAGQDPVVIDFGSVNVDDLYRNKPPQRSFALNLQDCDLTTAQNVRATINGNEETTLPGTLALGSASNASGFAFGFETGSGEEIKVNQEGKTFPLTAGDMSLDFIVLMKGLPDALSQKSIGAGDFSAQATLTLAYE